MEAAGDDGAPVPGKKTESSSGPERRSINSDIAGGLLGLALVALFFFNREQWSFWSAVFPNLTLAILGVLSAGLVIKGLRNPEMLPFLAEGNRVRIVVTAVLLLIWAFAFRPVGTITTSALIFYGLTLYLASAGRKLTWADALRWAVVVAVEIAVLYLIFDRLLAVPLPRGIWI